MEGTFVMEEWPWATRSGRNPASSVIAGKFVS
jgi:hypothetical protein